jgi:lipoprotein-anchoring transpeptidase ErfK/SrfK
LIEMRARKHHALRTACALGTVVALVTAATALAASPPPVAHLVRASQQLAVLNHDTEALVKPSRGTRSVGEVNEVRPITGERTVLPVVATTTTHGVQWFEVLLPGRPDSHTGWIEASAVSPSVTYWHIVVDLSTRQVTVYDHARVARTFLAVVGKPSTPTPTGNFFVEETVPLGPGASGAPFALALSARSNALAEFDGGPGQVALHGVANIGGVPGTAVSHGCVRLQTSDIAWLGDHISSGVPVTITN